MFTISERICIAAAIRSAFIKAHQIDEEQGNTRPKQNPMYALYMILERIVIGAVICNDALVKRTK